MLTFFVVYYCMSSAVMQEPSSPGFDCALGVPCSDFAGTLAVAGRQRPDLLAIPHKADRMAFREPRRIDPSARDARMSRKAVDKWSHAAAPVVAGIV